MKIMINRKQNRNTCVDVNENHYLKLFISFSFTNTVEMYGSVIL